LIKLYFFIRKYRIRRKTPGGWETVSAQDQRRLLLLKTCLNCDREYVQHMGRPSRFCWRYCADRFESRRRKLLMPSIQEMIDRGIMLPPDDFVEPEQIVGKMVRRA